MSDERRRRLEKALETMNPTTRAVLILRHFEHFTNAEAATELGLDDSAASKLYIRALKELKNITGRRPGDTT